MRSPIPAARSSIITRRPARLAAAADDHLSGRGLAQPGARAILELHQLDPGDPPADAGPHVPADAGGAGRCDADAEPEVRLLSALAASVARRLAVGANPSNRPPPRPAPPGASTGATSPPIRASASACWRTGCAMRSCRTGRRRGRWRSGCWSRVGAADGAPGEAHYLEHMAFMGSRRVPEGARARLSGASSCGSGTDFNAHTGDTDTYYRIDLARPDRRQIERILLLLRDMASELHPRAGGGGAGAGGDRRGGAAALGAGRPARARPDRLLRCRARGSRRRTLTGSETEAAAVNAEGLRRLYEPLLRAARGRP